MRRAPCRVTQISLTCKTWEWVERQRPLRLEQLSFVPGDLNTSYVTWHLRDTSRLREVQILGDGFHATTGNNYKEWVSTLLLHLSVSAPTLHSLVILPPRGYFEGEFQRVGHFLPLIGVLGQLETLVLRDWDYCLADIETIDHLTRLQNLKVVIS